MVTRDEAVEVEHCSCGATLARVAGRYSGWTCVRCNAAGDPELDHVEDEPPDRLDRWFCTHCPEGDVTRSDQDRCCLSCGVDLVSLTELRAMLSASGLHVVGAKAHAVLKAGNLVLDSSLRRIADENGGCLADWATAELARRGEQP